MATDYRAKALRHIIESYDELSDEDKRSVLDKIQYGQIMASIDQATKMKTATFGDLYEEAKAKQSTFNSFEGIACGLNYFDDAIMGFRPGEVTIIAAPSNTGKTLVGLNIISSMVCQTMGKTKALIISMEMTPEEIASRLYNLSAEEYHPLMVNNISIQTDLHVNADNIAAIVDKVNPDIVMIDMLQKLADRERGSEYERISTASAKVKQIALQSNKPIILISHVSKARSGNDGEANEMDLKGASNIEQDCDTGIMLNKSKKSDTRMIVRLFKHRTKRPDIFYKKCIIEMDGIKIANGGGYYIDE